MTKHISSTQNPIIKQLVLLKEKSRERKKTGLFLIEGKREIMLALKGNYALEAVLHNPAIIQFLKVNNQEKGYGNHSIMLTLTCNQI